MNSSERRGIAQQDVFLDSDLIIDTGRGIRLGQKERLEKDRGRGITTRRKSMCTVRRWEEMLFIDELAGTPEEQRGDNRQGSPEVPELRELCPAVSSGVIGAFSSPIQNHSTLAGVCMIRPNPHWLLLPYLSHQVCAPSLSSNPVIQFRIHLLSHRLLQCLFIHSIYKL